MSLQPKLIFCMNRADKRPLFRLREAFYIAAFAIAAILLAIYLAVPGKGSRAVVEKDGTVLESITLDHSEQRSYGGVLVNFSPQGVSVEKADCPDKVCLNTGTIEKAGEAIICVPNRLSIRLEGSGGYDGFTH